MQPSQRNTDYGYLPWHLLKPGEELYVPSTYNSLAWNLNRRFPDHHYSLHKHPSDPSLRVLRRNK